MTATTVYLIDDEPELLELLTDVVELTGLKAHDYTEAQHFFEQVKEFDIDSILVLDLNMPRMDGIEVMRRLATMNNPPALILVSGHDIGVLHSAEKLGRAHNLEIIASLSKPVALTEFRALLELEIHGRRSNKTLGTNVHHELFSSKELDSLEEQ